MESGTQDVTEGSIKMTEPLKIWGRSNSVNVQKVLWCCDELGLPFDRIDAGMQFGQLDTPAYRRLNPNGRIPTLVDGDFVLWESHAILRYLALRQSETDSRALELYPTQPKIRAKLERWLDWALGTLQPVERVLFQGMIRTPKQERNLQAIHDAAIATGQVWGLLDEHLAHGFPFIEGITFTLADLVLGAYARRWFGIAVHPRPDLKRLEGWYRGLCTREGFARYIAQPLS